MKLLALGLATAALATACSGGSSTGSTSSPADTAGTPSSQPSTTTSSSSPPSSNPTSASPPKPVATESNPPGDIPDNQVFVTFREPGFSVKVPEGWARSVTSSGVSFTDKLNKIEVSQAAAPAAPTPQSATATVVPVLRRTVPQFAMGKVSEITRPAGKVVLVTYQGDSAQDPVTGKVVRDAFERYLFYQANKQVALTLSGPVNADNVDPWKIVSESFRWL